VNVNYIRKKTKMRRRMMRRIIKRIHHIRALSNSNYINIFTSKIQI